MRDDLPRRAAGALAVAAFAGTGGAARADDQRSPAESPDESVEVTVQGDKPGGDAASRTSIGRRELELRPRSRPGDLVEAVPGLFAVQHAGGGKANQYFLRGFDADHGTDVALSVDGVPVNLSSHAHGQGFADLHFVIPELVVGVEARKGPYYADLGDFATAGAVDLRLAEKLAESSATFSIGRFGLLRGLVVASPDVGEETRAVVAAETYADDGPFVNPERLRRFNVFARVTRELGPRATLALTAMAYGSTWRGSGQIPARAVCGEGEDSAPPPSAYGKDCIDHFGYVDPSEGGATQRQQLSVAYKAAAHDADVAISAYLVRYRFDLFSNFTFFALDPARGDEIEQTDERVVVGGEARLRRHVHLGEAKLTTTVGADVRSDAIDTGLFHDLARERLEARVLARVDESRIGVFAEEDARLARWLRVVVGLRGQRADVAVDDRREDLATTGTRTSGVHGASLVLPKLMIVVSPEARVDVFADAGRGFHSNDARGVVLARAPATLLTPAMGYEVGVRVRPLDGLAVSAALYRLDLDSETVWSGDEGTTSAAGATRREGVELDARYRVGNWLFADVDATFARARYRENAGNGEAIALAPTRTLTAGVGARPTFGDVTPFASVRVKSIGRRPATEDESLVAEGFTVVDAAAGTRWKNVEVGLDVQNLLDARFREVQFAGETRLAYEPAAVRGLTYSPGWPRTTIARVSLFWP